MVWNQMWVALAIYGFLLILPSVVRGRFRYYACYVLFFISEGLLSFVVFPLSIFFYKDPKCFAISSEVIRGISRPLGISWELRNKEKFKKGAAIIVANHQSSFDILGMQYMNRFIGTFTAISKKELIFLFPWGLAGWLGGLIFIDRKTQQSKMAAIKQAMDYLNKGVKIWFFAEGTRNSDQKGFLPFKRGAFQLAIDSQTNIIPVVYSPFNLIDHENKEFKKGKVIISVLDEIETKGLTKDDVDKLLKETQRKMTEEYNRLSAESTGS